MMKSMKEAYRKSKIHLMESAARYELVRLGAADAANVALRRVRKYYPHYTTRKSSSTLEMQHQLSLALEYGPRELF